MRVVSKQSSLCPCSKNMSLLTNNVNQDQLDEISALSPDLQTKINNAGFGAHNQRSVIDTTVELYCGNNDIFWIEDLIDLAKLAASAETYNVLKREDEKYVTEVQYMGGYYKDGVFNEVPKSGPKFVEDIARDLASELRNKHLDKDIKDFVVVVNNEESIHTSLLATAVIHCDRNLK